MIRLLVSCKPRFIQLLVDRSGKSTSKNITNGKAERRALRRARILDEQGQGAIIEGRV